MANDEWGTPQILFDHLNKVFFFDVDVAAQGYNAKCDAYFGPDHVKEEKRDGLKASWEGMTCWCNPPYSDPLPWVEKAAVESSQHGATVVMLLPVDTSTLWFRTGFATAEEIWFMYPRVKFENAEGSPRWANMIMIWRPKVYGTCHNWYPKCGLWKWNEIEPTPMPG